MSLEFDAATHTYRLDGVRVPSVTQVLSLLEDFSRVPPEVLEAARQLGTHVHMACDLFDRGELDWNTLDAPLVPYVKAWARFLEESGAVVLASEQRVYHRALAYAGTLDVEATWNGNLCVIDRKTGVLPATVGPQTAAYEAAIAPAARRKRYCVQLSPEFSCGYKVHALTDAADWSIFLSALNCYKFREKHYGSRDRLAA